MKPLLIDAARLETGKPLERIPFGESPFSENALQEVLRRHPELLAIEEMDPVFAPAFCIGRETGTGAGSIDNLYVSPSGYLTIVETKLWKNPQARREVVAQVIDYTKQVAKWDYGRLEEAFEQYRSAYNLTDASLYSYACRQSQEELDETEFVDSVQRCLANGRFLLLIVGDGIHGNVAEMASYLQATPNLQFNLQLVEIACYRLPERKDSLVLVPTVVARTAEIERAVVRIEMSAEAAGKVLATTTIPPAGKPSVRHTMTRTEFLERLAKAVGADVATKTEAFVDHLLSKHELLSEEFAKNRLAIKAEFTGTERPPQTVLYIRYDGGVNTRESLWKFARTYGVPTKILESYFDRLGRIAPGLTVHRKEDGSYYRSKIDVEPIQNLLPKLPDLEQAIAALLEDIENLEGK